MINDMYYLPGETPLDPNEMEGLKFAHITTRGELNHLEQANIESGLMWLARRRSEEILTDTFIRELHRRLLGEIWQWSGSYRLTEKNIGVEPSMISVGLRNLLDDIKFWIKEGTYEPLEIAVRFHHRLVKIHPFPNGNGRHARIMADVILEKIYHKEPIDWAGGYDLLEMNERRTHYIDALRIADLGEYKPLFEFVGLTECEPVCKNSPGFQEKLN